VDRQPAQSHLQRRARQLADEPTDLTPVVSAARMHVAGNSHRQGGMSPMWQPSYNCRHSMRELNEMTSQEEFLQASFAVSGPQRLAGMKLISPLRTTGEPFPFK
jgi:hypothetical protein